MSKKTANIISITLMIIGAAFGIYTWIATGQSDDKVVQAAAINPLFIWMYILIAIAVLALIVVPLPYIISNPGTLKKFGIGIVALGVIILLAFLLSSDTPLPFLENAASKNEWSRWADVNILAMFIMTGIALLAIVFLGIKGIFRSNK